MTFSVFNQPIEAVAWPASLENLTFTFDFNQPIENVRWPAGLSVMRLGSAFNHPVAGVTWPPALRMLVIGRAFSQSVRESDLPEGAKVGRVDDRQDMLLAPQFQDGNE